MMTILKCKQQNLNTTQGRVIEKELKELKKDINVYKKQIERMDKYYTFEIEELEIDYKYEIELLKKEFEELKKYCKYVG